MSLTWTFLDLRGNINHWFYEKQKEIFPLRKNIQRLARLFQSKRSDPILILKNADAQEDA